jgi:hypothetical protein
MFEAGFKTFFPTTTQPYEDERNSRQQMHKRTKSDNVIESAFKKNEIVSRFFNDDCDDLSEITNVFHQKKYHN